MTPILLDRNENRYGPAPECLAALREIGPEVLFNYTRDFRKGYYSELSRRLAEMHNVEETRILLGYGCEDILKQAIHHFVGRGERCLIPSASWWYYRSIADEVGGVTVEYPIVEKPGAFAYDIEAMIRLRDEGPVRVLLISSPNNPTGNRFPADRLAEVLRVYRDAVVVYDEAYFGFSEDPYDEASEMTLRHPNLLVLRTFSKLYGLAGARIGYGIAGAGLDSLRRFSSRNLGYSRISERLALAALSNPEYYARIRRSMIADRKRILFALRDLPGVDAWDSDANFVLARFPSSSAATLKSELERRGLVLKFFAEPAFADFVRITLGTPDEISALIVAVREIYAAISVCG